MARRQFEIDRTRELGGGASANVFSGTYRGAQVAIKRMLLSQFEFHETSNREADALLRLNHPNVLKLFHWEDDDDFRYLVLELCSGSLGGFLSGKYKGPMPSDIDALKQMAAGVKHIHSNDLVHRDLKPENILISNSALKISDFGFCKKMNERGTFSLTSGIKGTFGYMAPELLVENPERGTVKSDVFALGCIFYEFLTRGGHPFGKDNLVIGRITKGEFNLEELGRNPFHRDLVKEMIQNDPQERPNIFYIVDSLEPLPNVQPPERAQPFPQLPGIERPARELLLVPGPSARVPHSFPPVTPYSITSQECYGASDSEVSECRFHPSKPKLACALERRRVCIFSSPSVWTPFQQWTKILLKAKRNCEIQHIDWNVDGSKLAAGCSDGMLIVWEEDGAKCFENKKHSEAISCIRWNKAAGRSNLLVTGSLDKTVVLWDSLQQMALQTFRFHASRITDVTWIRADAFASCSWDQTIKIGRIGESTAMQTFHHPDNVRAIRLIEEDKRFASCTVNNSSIQIWSLDRNHSIATLTADYGILCFDCHRRSTTTGPRWRIAGGCFQMVYLWELTTTGTAASRRVLYGHTYHVMSVAFSPDGRFIASVDKLGIVIIWSTQRGNVIYQTEEVSEKSLVGINYGYSLNWLPSGNKLAVTIFNSRVYVIEFAA